MEIQPGKFPEQSTYLSGELLAKALASLASEEEQTIQEVDLSTSFVNWCGIESQDGLSGKMSPVSCQVTAEGILQPSSQHWGTSGMGGRTVSLTLTTSVSPSGGGESGLLRTVLETGSLPQELYLTSKACAGILRRADAKGRPLPPHLRSALMKVVSSEASEASAPTLTLDLTQDKTPTAEG